VNRVPASAPAADTLTRCRRYWKQRALSTTHLLARGYKIDHQREILDDTEVGPEN